MPLLHLLRRLIRHIVSDAVDGIADEGEYAENDKQDEQGGEFRESRHHDGVIGRRGGLFPRGGECEAEGLEFVSMNLGRTRDNKGGSYDCIGLD